MRPDAVSVLAGLAAVLTAVAQLGRWLWKRQELAEPSDDSLNHLANLLARQVHDEWDSAATHRGLRDPAPMPVRWHRFEGVTSGLGDAIGSSSFKSLPGFPLVSTKEVQAGGQTELLNVFAGLASGRIIIVGTPGSGKSTAAILLLLDVLKYREGLRSEEQALVPVPVLFTLRGWDPSKHAQSPPRGPHRHRGHVPSLLDWLDHELTRTYPFLRTRGRAVRRRLITSNRLAFFLDGLDELPQELRAPVLATLGRQATFRLLVLSRSTEMVNTVSRGHLGSAAALELEPIPASLAADYLASAQCDPLPRRWQPLVKYLRTHSDSTICSALNNPLAVTLVRDTYQDSGDPAELLDANGLGGYADVSDYLLARVLPAAYALHPGEKTPPYSLDVASRGLAYIAARMEHDKTRDLAWWKVSDWVSRTPRLIITGLLYGLLIGLIFGFARGPTVGLLAALVTALLEVLGQAGYLERSAGPRRLGTLRWNTLLRWPTVSAGVALGLAFGIMGWVIAGFVYAFAFGLAAGLVAWFAVALGQPGTEESPDDPLSCWRKDRNFGLVFGLVVGLEAGVGLGLTLGLGFVYGLVSGLVGGLVGGLFYPNTWRTAVACGQLRLSGHTPLRLMKFLQDAYDRNVLRTVGPIYQFRHANLQDRLAKAWECSSKGQQPGQPTSDPHRSDTRL